MIENKYTACIIKAAHCFKDMTNQYLQIPLLPGWWCHTDDVLYQLDLYSSEGGVEAKRSEKAPAIKILRDLHAL